MPKSQKKSANLNEKPQVTRRPSKCAEITSIKSPKLKPKVTKKITGAPEKFAGDSKQAMILALLQRPAGATIDEMAKATGWQRHSVHGMMSGVLKKKLGLTVASDKEDRGRVYRITGSVSRL